MHYRRVNLTFLSPCLYRLFDMKRIKRTVPYIVVFISSMGIMIIELVASRLVSKYFGNSLYTWTGVIGVVLGGISLGNYIGGRLADRFEPKKIIVPLLLIASFIRLRARQPGRAGPYRAVGGAPAAWLAGALSCVVLASCWRMQPVAVGVTVVALLLLWVLRLAGVLRARAPATSRNLIGGIDG